MRTIKIIFRDVFKEIFRLNVSYIIFIIFLVGISHAVLLGLSVLGFSSGFSQEAKLLFIATVITLISFFYFGIITLTLFLNNSIKDELGKKYSLMFYGISLRRLIFLRVFAIFIAMLFIMVLWYVILFIINLYRFQIPLSLYWKISFFTMIPVFLILPIPLFFSMHLTGFSTIFVSFIPVFLGFLRMFSSPYIKMRIAKVIYNIIEFLPDWSALLFCYINKLNERYSININIPISPYPIVITVCFSLLFLLLSIHSSKRLEV
jgi:hypothetical protein